jgi:hypothetical protein
MTGPMMDASGTGSQVLTWIPSPWPLIIAAKRSLLSLGDQVRLGKEGPV